MAYKTRKHLVIDIATIEKGSGYLGMVSSIKPEDIFTQWRSEFESDILVSLASLAGERMFFDGDSTSGVSGDLQQSTTIASLMEGFYGMGKTVFSFAANQTLQIGTPGGRGQGNREDPQAQARRALADRIEDSLSTMLERVAGILRENERYVLAIAHALETYKTLSGEDVTAVMDGSRGPLVDGTPYADDNFIELLREYHQAAKQAHHEHSTPHLPLPVHTPAYAIADYGSGGLLDGSFGGNGNGNGDSNGTNDVIDFGGFGTGNGSHGGPLGAPTYDPPASGGSDDPDGGQS
jgi:hypothetical protein